MKNTRTVSLPDVTTRWIRIGLTVLLSVLILALASCSSRRAGITHHYNNEFGSGTIYIEGSDYGHHGKKPKKLKKPKKPKKHKKHHRHDD